MMVTDGVVVKIFGCKNVVVKIKLQMDVVAQKNVVNRYDHK